MTNPPQNFTYKHFPFGMKLVIGYFFLAGVIELVWPLLYPTQSIHSASYQAGAYIGKSLPAIAYLVAGFGLLRRSRWAKMLAYIALVVATILAANDFAQGLSLGFTGDASARPSQMVTVISLALSVAWHMLWGVLLYRNFATIDRRTHAAGA